MESLSYSELKDGMKVFGRIQQDQAPEVFSIGVITIEEGKIYVCQNEISGWSCKDKKGYKYSWVLAEVENQADYGIELYPLQENQSAQLEMSKCADLALRIASMYPDAPGAFEGTVSEQLNWGVDRLLSDLSTLRDALPKDGFKKKRDVPKTKYEKGPPPSQFAGY